MTSFVDICVWLMFCTAILLSCRALARFGNLLAAGMLTVIGCVEEAHGHHRNAITSFVVAIAFALAPAVLWRRDRRAEP